MRYEMVSSPDEDERGRVAQQRLPEDVGVESSLTDSKPQRLLQKMQARPIGVEPENAELLQGRNTESRSYRAEEALRRSQQTFSKVFFSTPAILAITTVSDSRFIEVNDCFERSFGYTREEVIGRTAFELNIWLDPADRAEVVETMHRCGRVRDFETKLRDKSGRIFLALYSSEFIDINGEQCLLSVASDITERISSLKASEERYRMIVETSQEGIIALDAKANFVYVNRQFCEKLGLNSDQMLGRPYLDFIEASLHDEVRARLERRKDGEPERYDTIFVGKDGTRTWGSVSAVTVMGAQGEFVGSFATVVDLTQRKQALEEIEVLNTNLSQRARELEVANEELEAFSYTVSHDLRRPLSTIGGYSQLILEMFSDDLDENCKYFVQEIVKGTFMMNQLIETLLTFSCKTGSEMKRETVGISDMVQDVIAELQRAEPQRRVACTVEQGVTVDADPRLLLVVLDNLLGNAWKYTAKTLEPVIEFGVRGDEGKAVYFIRDNGVGFDMAQAGQLFTPFQRFQVPADFEGAGIGLATVQRIIQRHGGQIWAEGEIGKGATFYFTLD